MANESHVVRGYLNRILVLSNVPIMYHLPPYRKFTIEESGLRYRIFCSHTLHPTRELGVAGDLYIVAETALLFYKEVTTIDRQGKWRLASDQQVVHHPFEYSHRLVATRTRWIQWSTDRSKKILFEDAIPFMTKLVLAPFLGRISEYPLDVDDD